MMISRGLLSHPTAVLASRRPLKFPLLLRNRSTRSGKLIEIDLESTVHASSSSASSSTDGEIEVIGLKGLEESINFILALKYTPDWISFRPGSSFWVPPRTVSAAEYLGRLGDPWAEDESLSFTALRSRPCFNLLSRQDVESSRAVKVESEADSSKPEVVEIQAPSTSERDSESEDDE